MYRSEQAEPFCPQEFHETVVRMAEKFFEWFDAEDEEEEAEEERE